VEVVIRDDDTCCFTKPEEIHACYEQVWDDVPVSLSVTPYRIPGNDKNLPGNLLGCRDVLPLHENNELVHVLRSGIIDGRIDISMHGYHHLTYKGKPEYIGGDDLTRKTIDGRNYLETLLGLSVKTFVPPNNGISKTGLEAVINAGMNLVNIPSLWSVRKRNISAKTLSIVPKYYWHRKVMKKSYPYVLDMGDHKEIGYHTVGPKSTSVQLLAELDYCARKNGVFVLATHYHAFDKRTQDGNTVRALLYKLIDRAMALPDTRFLGINTVW